MVVFQILFFWKLLSDQLNKECLSGGRVCVCVCVCVCVWERERERERESERSGFKKDSRLMKSTIDSR